MGKERAKGQLQEFSKKGKGQRAPGEKQWPSGNQERGLERNQVGGAKQENRKENQARIPVRQMHFLSEAIPEITLPRDGSWSQ